MSNNRIQEWRDAMFSEFKRNFRRDKGVVPFLLMYNEDEDKMEYSEMWRYTKEEYYEALVNAINDVKPDAYILVGAGSAVKARVGEEAERVQKAIDDAGGVNEADLKDKLEVAIFVFETKESSLVQMFEVIRIDDDAVMSPEPTMEFSNSKGAYTGHLNKTIGYDYEQRN